MDTVDHERMSSFFKALGNPTRLKIVMEIMKGERCVSDVESLVSARQSNISQHLAVLKECDIVECRKVGNMRCYSLKQPVLVKAILNVLEKEGE